MREIMKVLSVLVDGKPMDFRLTKLDAFSGAALLRLLLRLEEKLQRFSILDLVSSLSEEELRSVMETCLNHTEVLLPAGPNPVMAGKEWGYPELKHDAVTCMTLTVESISWSLSGFFGEGGPGEAPARPATAP